MLISSLNLWTYVGFMSNLPGRAEEHKLGEGSQFTKKYKVNKLVYYEIHHDVHQAFLRERQIKKWNRQWKINLIENDNPEWEDLYLTLNG